MLGRVLLRLRVPDPDPAVVAQGLQEPDDAAVLRPPPQGHVSVQVLSDTHRADALAKASLDLLLIAGCQAVIRCARAHAHP